MIKVIIAGGRDFRDIIQLRDVCDEIFAQIEGEIRIVSGCQVTEDKTTGEKYGADYLGEYYAENMRGYIVDRFPPDWKSYGKAAGPIRNKQMAKYADYLIAFWDGKSRGTKNMIYEANKLALKVVVVNY